MTFLGIASCRKIHWLICLVLIVGTGTLSPSTAQLVRKVQKKAGRKQCPTASSIDSPSVKTTQVEEEARGLDDDKHVKGRKRFILVDTMGLLLAAKVVAANTAEKVGAKLLVEKIRANNNHFQIVSKGRSGD